MPRVLNMPKSEHGKVLNMAEFSICECYTALWISEAATWGNL